MRDDHARLVVPDKLRRSICAISDATLPSIKWAPQVTRRRSICQNIEMEPPALKIDNSHTRTIFAISLRG